MGELGEKGDYQEGTSKQRQVYRESVINFAVFTLQGQGQHRGSVWNLIHFLIRGYIKFGHKD